jgi:hypothetical protein
VEEFRVSRDGYCVERELVDRINTCITHENFSGRIKYG